MTTPVNVVSGSLAAIKDEIVSLRTIMGEFIKTDARRKTDYLHLAARVDRIERRLADHEHPRRTSETGPFSSHPLIHILCRSVPSRNFPH
jgi:hypothetical protein